MAGTDELFDIYLDKLFKPSIESLNTSLRELDSLVRFATASNDIDTSAAKSDLVVKTEGAASFGNILSGDEYFNPAVYDDYIRLDKDRNYINALSLAGSNNGTRLCISGQS